LSKRIQILLVVGALLLIMGTLLDITRDPFMWGTDTVTALFMMALRCFVWIFS